MKARWKPIVIGSLISLVLLASFPIIAVAGKLNADEVKQLVSGNTLVFRVVEGYEGGRKETRYYDANGTFRQFNKKKNKTVKGKWHINDKSELCNITKKRGACHVIYKRGNVWETYVKRPDPTSPDKHILTIEKVLKGNPNGL
jgi:hypothetical protein